jgi:C4-dicarboxylate-specific signal transduction histidine kinase
MSTVAAPTTRTWFGRPPAFLKAIPVVVVLLVLGLAPMELVGSVALQGTRDRLTDLVVANLTSRSAATAASIDTYIQTRRRDIVAVSQYPDVIAYAQNLGDPTQRNLARAALAGAATVSPEYESIAVLDLNGTIMAASILTDEGTNVRFRDYFQNARTGQVYISDPSYSVITNKPALFFSAPVKTTDGVLVGVVRSRVNLAVIWDLVEADLGSVGVGARSFMVDDFGIRLAVSETKGNRAQAESLIYKVIAPIERETALKLAADRRFGQKSAEQLIVDPLPELKSVVDSMTRAGSVPFSFFAAGVEQRAVATRLESKPWVYVLTMPPASYTSVLAGASSGQTTGVIVAVALAALIAVWLGRAVMRSDAASARGDED